MFYRNLSDIRVEGLEPTRCDPLTYWAWYVRATRGLVDGLDGTLKALLCARWGKT